MIRGFFGRGAESESRDVSQEKPRIPEALFVLRAANEKYGGSSGLGGAGSEGNGEGGMARNGNGALGNWVTVR